MHRTSISTALVLSLAVGCSPTARCFETCAGCCADDGTCLSGNSEAQCGHLGAACATCTSEKACLDGVCTTPPGTSQPTTDGGTDAGPVMDAGLVRDGGLGEGEPCTATPQCAEGICRVTLSAGGAGNPHCSVCLSSTMQGLGCGDGGHCVTVFGAGGVDNLCSPGQRGDPCHANTDCRSGTCATVVTAAGVTTSCD
jgi:hypothetical protein